MSVLQFLPRFLPETGIRFTPEACWTKRCIACWNRQILLTAPLNFQSELMFINKEGDQKRKQHVAKAQEQPRGEVKVAAATAAEHWGAQRKHLGLRLKHC